MNEKKLRPYQEDIIQCAINSKGNILIQAPTGAGKTLIAEHIVNYHKKENKKILFLAPKINLLSQTANAFKNLNPQVIHVSNKEKIDLNAHAFVSTIQTMSKRTDFLEKMKFDYIILDEMHYGAKGEMQKAIRLAHTGKIIGLSATPYDADGKLLTQDFETIIDKYDTKYMVDNGYLINIRSYEAYTPNLEGVKIKSGEWDIQELDIRFNKPEIVNKIVSITKNIIEKREKIIVFCINISHAEAMTKAYESVNLKVGVTHSKIKKELQEKIMNDFKNGELKVLVSVNQLTTGFDVPSTDTIVLARPTKSQNLYKQIVGRALRLSPETNKKEALILDCAGVISTLGMPLSPIVEINKEERKRKIYSCKKCKSIKPRIFEIVEDKTKPITICPDCKDELLFKPKFVYICQSCNRYYDFKMDISYFNFENEYMKLKCSCGEITNLGSLNDDDIDFRELSEEEQLNFDLERISDKNLSENILDELSKSNNIQIRQKVVFHKNTSKDTLIKMAKDDFNSSFNGVIIENGERIFYHDFFLNHPKIKASDIFEVIDYRKDKEILEKNYSYPTKYFRMVLKLVTHKKATKELLNVISKHTNLNFLQVLIKNLKAYTKKELPKKHYMEKQKYLETKLDDKFVKNIETLLDLFADKDELKIDVAINDSISNKTLKKLYNQKNVDIKYILERNPKFKDVLKKEVFVSYEDIKEKKLTKEEQLKVANSKNDLLKTELLKKYKSKDIFFKCIESIPNANDEIEDNKENIFELLQRSNFINKIVKHEHFSSEILKYIIDTKHKYIIDELKKLKLID